MNVYEHVGDMIHGALKVLQQEQKLAADIELPKVETEAPRDPAHGDMASNIAMVLAKRAGQKPRDLAQLVAEKLTVNDDIQTVDIAGPGFLNIKMSNSIWERVTAAILNQGPQFGRAQLGEGAKVNLEYVSANPTGPMHVGHCRGAVFGDALANLLEFSGHDVAREYYVNDAGGQIDVLAKSAYLRYREALGEDIGSMPEGLYPGDYLKPVGQILADSHGKSLKEMDEDQWLPIVREIASNAMMDLIREDLAALNIHHDVFFSESSMTQNGHDQIKDAIEALRKKGLIYEGQLPKPKGHEDEEWEEREQTLFRSTDFGDDVDRALMKSDGTYTYFAGDIAYHYNKIKRGYTHLINVFGADHIGYLPRMTAAVKALSDGNIDFDIKVCQLVKLYRDGEPVRMSKRAGNFVTLRELVEEVGVDPVRFMMLYRKNDAPLDFDFSKVTEQSKDNPVFYVQYAHARAASVLRNAKEAFPDMDISPSALAKADLTQLSDQGELALIKLLSGFPNLVLGAARAHEPHRLAFYLYEVASTLHKQWGRGNDSPHLRFIHTDSQGVTASRLALVAATQQVISSGLGILGVQAPESMR